MFKLDLIRYKENNLKLIHEPAIIIIFLYRLRKNINKISFLPFRILCNIIVEPINLFLMIFLGIHLPKKSSIGAGLIIHHFGGIILNSHTIIGKNCTLRHNVTIGNKSGYDDVPIIGDNVNIGCGAVIIGRIKIGNNVFIGANAVVLKDIPDNCIVVGNPARIIRK